MRYYCLLCKYSLSLVKYYQECAEIRKLEGREWFLGARKLREFCFLLIFNAVRLHINCMAKSIAKALFMLKRQKRTFKRASFSYKKLVYSGIHHTLKKICINASPSLDVKNEGSIDKFGLLVRRYDAITSNFAPGNLFFLFYSLKRVVMWPLKHKKGLRHIWVFFLKIAP